MNGVRYNKRCLFVCLCEVSYKFIFIVNILNKIELMGHPLLLI